MGFELKSSGLHSKRLYPLSYLTSPVTSLLVYKAAAIFPRLPVPTWFWVGVDYEKNLYTTGKAEMKQQWLPSEGHLVSRTDKHRALSAGPGRPAKNSRLGAYIALRWRAPALSNYHNIIWCWEKGVETGIEKKTFMNFLKIKATWWTFKTSSVYTRSNCVDEPGKWGPRQAVSGYFHLLCHHPLSRPSLPLPSSWDFCQSGRRSVMG